MRATHFVQLIILVAMLALVPAKEATAQSKAGIFNVDFTVSRDSLIITYDILKSKFSERFNITFTVKAVTGKTYAPKTVTGDVGNNVFGGKGKRIVWEVSKDNVLIDEEVFVEVLGQPVVEGQQPAAAVVTAPVKSNADKGAKTFSKGGAIALSAIFPGWGISKQKQGGAYWLIGVATYGVAAAGIFMNMSSSSTYDKYKEATTADERNTLYDKAVSQNKTGNILLYTAAGLWVCNMVWTIATPNKVKSSGFSFGGSIDPGSARPVFCCQYKF